MRVVVTGATGNVGSALLPALAERPEIDEIVGLARRPPAWDVPKVKWHAADIQRDDLTELFRGAAVVIHLVWIIQPSRDAERQRQVNIGGLERVLAAVRAAGVGRFIHASSVGAYSRAPRDHAVDETWPTDGMATLPYSWQKAYAERLVERFEHECPDCTVLRIRPSLVMQRAAGHEVGRYFLGPLVPPALLPPRAVLAVLDRGPIRLQAVHATDLARAFVLAACSDVTGALNVAGPGVVGGDRPALQRIAQVLAGTTFAARLQPTGRGWVEAAAHLPLMDTGRIERELGWHAAWPAREALRDLLSGLHEGATGPTPALS
jgi:nucleoside-diphosphate-sugar epimerase